MKFKEFLNEMADISKFNSGWLKEPEAKALVKAFRAGEVTAEVNGQSYKASKKVTATSLKKGQVVFGSYNSTNQGAQIYEILGFQAGDDGPTFDTVKQLLAHYEVVSLRELEAKNSGAKLVVKDIADGSQGPWFYIYKGSWARGSGAEKLSFVEVEKV